MISPVAKSATCKNVKRNEILILPDSLQ